MLTSEMLTEMRDHGFDDLSDSRLLGFVNDTYYDVCSREAWPFLEATALPATVAGADFLALPSDFQALLALSNDSTGTNVRYERRENIYMTFENQRNYPGEPVFCYLSAGVLRITPVPASVYAMRLHYIKVPASLRSDDSVAIALPAQHHRVLVLGALQKAYLMDDDPETSAVFEQQYESRIARMRESLMRVQYDRPDRIVDVDAGDHYFF